MTLKIEANARGYLVYQIIIKCVDGKAKEFYDYNDIKNIYKNESKITDWFSGKI